MTDKLALLGDADSLESWLTILDEEDDDGEEARPGWTHPFPSEQRWHILQLLMPVAGGPTYLHVVNGYFQPVLRTQAQPTFLTGSESVVAELRSYVDDHFDEGEFHPLTDEEAYDIDVILSRCAFTESLTLDRAKPSIPLAGWVYVTFREAPKAGTWLAERGPRSAGGQWPEFYILTWEPRP